jgi:hypothetical protein
MHPQYGGREDLEAEWSASAICNLILITVDAEDPFDSGPGHPYFDPLFTPSESASEAEDIRAASPEL